MKSRLRILAPVLIALAVLAALWLRMYLASNEEVRPTADLLIERARLLDGRLSNVLVDDGVVVGVGYKPSFGRDYIVTQRLDAAGGVLIGGVHDYHAHVFVGGARLQNLQLNRFKTRDQLDAGIKAWAEAHPELPWIRGSGWFYSMFLEGLPTREMLDELIPDRPVSLQAFDGHARWANSLALEKAGVDAESEDPPEGTIVRDAVGEPTGVFLETAQRLLEDAAPDFTEDEQADILANALQYMLRRGVTAVDDMVFRDIDQRVRLYERLYDEDRLPVRLRLLPVVEGDVTSQHFDRIVALRDRLSNHPRLSIPGIKLFLDGVIESKTAYLLEPYATDESRGVPRLAPERLLEIMEVAAQRKLAVAMHSVGDAATRMALDQLEAMGPNRPPLVRLEHLELVAPEDHPRLAALGVQASMQPLHADPGGPNPEVGAWAENLGAERLPLTFPIKSLERAGVALRFGSDWPVVDCDPLPGIAVALTRQSAGGEPKGGWFPDERISLASALRAYGAVPNLEPGAPANLAVIAPGVAFSDPRTLWVSTVTNTSPIRAVVAHGEVYDFSRSQ